MIIGRWAVEGRIKLAAIRVTSSWRAARHCQFAGRRPPATVARPRTGGWPGSLRGSRHRVFNPVRQGQRFDPSGDYVRRYLPQLAALPAATIHDPPAAARRACGYPAPIVDHREAIAAYRAVGRHAAARPGQQGG